MENHELELVHLRDRAYPRRTTHISGSDVRSLRTFVEQGLRTENCKAAKELYLLLNDIVYAQAYEQGKKDALENDGRFGLSQWAGAIWRDGYEHGFAEGMSQRQPANRR